MGLTQAGPETIAHLVAQGIQGGMHPRQLGMFKPEKLKFSLLNLFHGCFSR